jgi:hypothetical protein
MTRSVTTLAFAVVLLAASVEATIAAEPPATPDPDPWRYNVALYGWALGVTGNVTARNQTIDTNASFIDIVQKSDSLGAFMGYMEADKGRLGVYTDLVFAKLGFAAGQTNYRNPLPGLSITTTANAALTYQLFIVETGGVYEFFHWPGTSEGSSTSLDGLLAFRYWNNSIDASFDATANVNLNLPAFGIERSRGFGVAIARADAIQWVDPVVGLRLRHQFTPRQEIMVRGDVGGFGMGSQFSWQAVAVYSYSWQFTGYQVAGLLGFRALGVNYVSPGGGGVGINEVLYGPIIGASFRF